MKCSILECSRTQGGHDTVVYSRFNTVLILLRLFIYITCADVSVCNASEGVSISALVEICPVSIRITFLVANATCFNLER